MAQGSERVRQRTGRLIKLVELPSVHERSQKLLECCYGRGQLAFLERWLRCPTTAGNLWSIQAGDISRKVKLFQMECQRLRMQKPLHTGDPGFLVESQLAE